LYNLRFLWTFARPYRATMFLGLFFGVCSAAVSASGPYVLRLGVDDIQRQGVDLSLLLSYSGLLLLLALVDGVFKFFTRRLVIGGSNRIERDLRLALFDRFLVLEQDFYSRNHTGDLMARATNDLSSVRQFMGPGVNSVVLAVFTLTAAGVLMLAINLTLALVVLLLLPLVTLFFVLIGRRMRAVFGKVQHQFGDISTRAQENFSGIRTIKAYAQEQAEIAVFRQDNELYRQFNLRYVLLSGLLWPAVALILGLVAALVLLVGGRMVAEGTLTLGELVQFNAYLGLLSFPMIALGWTVNLYQQAMASLERLQEVLQRQPKIASASSAPAGFNVQGDIEFRNVGIRFSHDLAEQEAKAQAEANPKSKIQNPKSDGWVLRDISFKVPRGSSLAIVGPTGVGKTTLVQLLGRVRDPDEGQVLVDGVDVRELPLAALRRAIAYVPQETFLFSVPLRENVLFGVEHTPVPAVGSPSRANGAAQEDELATRTERAVQISKLSNDLSQFPNGLDTLVGERGVTLSGGQKQRTAIARAVMRDPAILVLDDALSSVDTHTAAEILAGLRETMRERTSIIIAQRIGTVKDANYTIVLHNGHIEEQGKHHELLKQGGRYAAMYRRELLEAELNVSDG
jgi:ATP-binding cassette subfamily B protein